MARSLLDTIPIYQVFRAWGFTEKEFGFRSDTRSRALRNAGTSQSHGAVDCDSRDAEEVGRSQFVLIRWVDRARWVLRGSSPPLPPPPPRPSFGVSEWKRAAVAVSCSSD